MGTNLRQIIFTFHNQQTSISDGNELNVGTGSVLMNIDISGTGTATLVFEGKSNDKSNYYPIMCVNLSTMEMATSTTAVNSLWQFGLEGLTKVRVRLSAVSGTISVIGTVVN